MTKITAMEQAITNSTLQRLSVFVVLALIVCLGFGLRLIALQETVVNHPIRADARQYILYAYNLSNHETYSLSDRGLYTEEPPPPDAIRSPGYPLFLSVFINKIQLAEIDRALMAQTLVSGLTVLLVFLICRQISATGWALVAAGFTAISPHLINANVYLLTETMFSFSVTVLFLFLCYAYRSGSGWMWLLVGMLMGASALIRPSIQYFPILIIGLIILHMPRRQALAAAGPMTLGFFLLFSPWVIRNVLVIGQASDPRLMINFLHHGMYPGFMYNFDPQSYGYPYRFDPEANVIASSMNSVIREIAVRFQEQPMEHLRWFLLGKPMIFLSWDIIQGMGDSFVYEVLRTPYANQDVFRFTHKIARTAHWPLMALAAVGSICVWLPSSRKTMGAKSFPLRALSLLLLYYLAIHIIGAPFPRYSVPLRPMFFSMAVIAAWVLIETTRSSLARQGFQKT